MRTREEIASNAFCHEDSEATQHNVVVAMLEVLLDIRDLLTYQAGSKE
jgi:hypothetical protein